MLIAVPAGQAIKHGGGATAGTPIDATPQDAATTGSEFRLTDGERHFSLDTGYTGISQGIWLLVATLSDGSGHSVWVQIR